MAGRARRPIYSRGDNPTVRRSRTSSQRSRAPRRRAASRAAWRRSARPCSSNLSAGERMVCVRHCYPDAYRLFATLLPRFDIEVEFVDGRDADAVERGAAGRQGALSGEPDQHGVRDPGSRAPGRRGASARARSRSPTTPGPARSFSARSQHGVDLVVHSASKYLGGHSDVVAGVVCRPARADRADQRRRLPAARRQALAVRRLAAGARPAHPALAHAPPSRERARDRASGSPRTRAVRAGAPSRCSATPARVPPRCPAHRACSASSSTATRPASRRFCDALAPVQARRQLGRPREPGLPGRGRSRASRARPTRWRSSACRPATIRLHIGLEDPEDLWSDLRQALECIPPSKRRHGMRGSLATIGAGRRAALLALAWPASAQTTLQLVEVITSPQRTEVAAGHGRPVRGGQSRRHGRDHLAALGPGVREARDHGPGRPDPGRGRDARPLAVALRQQRPAGRPRRPTWQSWDEADRAERAHASSSAATSTTRRT